MQESLTYYFLCVSTAEYVDGELWLASCSQDCLIRVWKLFAKTAAEPDHQTDAIIKMKENIIQVSGDGETGGFA